MDHHHQHRHQHSGHAHEHDAASTAPTLFIASDPARPQAGQPVNLRLMIHAADGAMVREFAVAHEEKVHLVIVREGLDTFAHVHPTVDASGDLKVTYTFPMAGIYRLFADFTPVAGQHATATGTITIDGQAPRIPPLVANAPGVVEADGLRAAVSTTLLAGGSATRVSFSLRDDHGEPVRLERYMGELGHLMFIAAGSWRYVHVHPVGGDEGQGSVEFEAHFPEAGLYKGWAQFKQDGRVRVVPIVLRVE